MDALAIGLSLFWLFVAAVVTAVFERFAAQIRRSARDARPARSLPDALVVLSLRGSDESLRETLDGLAAQDYPKFQICVVIDHRTDPADRIVRAWQRRHPAAPIRIEYLTNPPQTCTLKAAAIRQALQTVERVPGGVVLVDGDADPYPTWLRDAVRPLEDERVGAVSGNRWYLPRQGDVVSWSRFCFAAFSLPAMDREGYAWGGTLALRGEHACSERFLQLLAERPTEEQAAYDALREWNLRLLHNPQLVQWNPESIALTDLSPFFFRQMMMGRFYYPTWNHMLGGAIGLVAAALASLAFFVATVPEYRPVWMGPLFAAAIFSLTTAAALQRLHGTLQKHVFARQGRVLPTLGLRDVLKVAASLPITLAAYAAAIVRVHFATEAVWRRIRYRMLAHGIERTEYRPFIHAETPPATAAEPSRSFAT